MKLITREKLEHIAKKILNYPLHDAEKDYFLGLVMKIISKSSLKNELIFKGGTAIYHCYLDQLRFSEDLDFTSLKKNINLNELKSIFKKYEIFEIKKEFISKATLKIERLKYIGVLNTPNSIKLEVDKLQNVYLKPKERKYQNVWDIDFKVKVMDPIEICAEKIRACNERFRYRDFYDLYMLANNLKVNINSSVKILPKKEIRKNISKANILKNLNYALGEINEKSDAVFYKIQIEKKDLVSFFKNLEIPKINKSPDLPQSK